MRRNRRGGGSGLEFGGSGEDSFVAVVVTKLTGALLFILLLTMVIMALLPKAIDSSTHPQDEGTAEADRRPLKILTPEGLPEAIAGRPYTVALAADGGRGPLHWSLDGALPDGLAFDSDLGLLEGDAGEGNSQARRPGRPGERRREDRRGLAPPRRVPERRALDDPRLVEARNSPRPLARLARPGSRVSDRLARPSGRHGDLGEFRATGRRRGRRDRRLRRLAYARPAPVRDLSPARPPEHVVGHHRPGRLALDVAAALSVLCGVSRFRGITKVHRERRPIETEKPDGRSKNPGHRTVESR